MKFDSDHVAHETSKGVEMRSLFALLAFVVAAPAIAAEPRTNVVLILIDDMGWTDLGCYGSDLYRSPNVDKLAMDGMKFTGAYSACCVCSPTRAAVMTGKYPARLRVTDWIPGLIPTNPKLTVPDWTKHLPANEPTIAQAFKAAGYATASIGKWHLGGPDYYPEKFGFDLNVAGTEAAAPKSYFAPWKIATLTEGKDHEYLTDRLGDEAVKFITANKDRPFFLYLPHFAVHLPIQGPADLVKEYQGLLKPGMKHTNPAYAAMVERADAAVGQVRTTLAKLGLTDRTVILFASDNGGHLPTTSNKPLRAGKASCYEGGVRVPTIVYWPGVTKPGSECATPVMSIDFFPTLLEMAKVTAPANARPDGESIVPLLRQTGTVKRDSLYWHYPHYQHYQLEGTTPYGAVRTGDFKLIEHYDDKGIELYNIAADIGEKNDLAAAQPERTKAMLVQLAAWRNAVGAQMPTKNPKYDPTKPEHSKPITTPGKAQAPWNSTPSTLAFTPPAD
jgi:arylsulfatase A